MLTSEDSRPCEADDLIHIRDCKPTIINPVRHESFCGLGLLCVHQSGKPLPQKAFVEDVHVVRETRLRALTCSSLMLHRIHACGGGTGRILSCDACVHACMHGGEEEST
ncbi:hypothetical protein FQA47_017298 [Oryzias melastigma]|uniref:Uncharacterized protein n=1 Tax=Oryzias melastigma TaxID=30732 RepID=A0A834BS93_ORYME|nr:hypothetical protein FQA47_017298 [Oryzias melastigma]